MTEEGLKEDNTPSRMEEEANQLYQRPQMTGHPRPPIAQTEVSAAIQRLKQM